MWSKSKKKVNKTLEKNLTIGDCKGPHQAEPEEALPVRRICCQGAHQGTRLLIMGRISRQQRLLMLC